MKFWYGMRLFVNKTGALTILVSWLTATSFVCMQQVHFLVCRFVLCCVATLVTSWFKSTSRPSSSLSCRGCLSGSTSTPVRLASRSAFWRCWRRRPWAARRVSLCRECPTSKRSTSGWLCALCSCLLRWSSTPSSTLPLVTRSEWSLLRRRPSRTGLWEADRQRSACLAPQRRCDLCMLLLFV